MCVLQNEHCARLLLCELLCVESVKPSIGSVITAKTTFRLRLALGVIRQPDRIMETAVSGWLVAFVVSLVLNCVLAGLMCAVAARRRISVTELCCQETFQPAISRAGSVSSSVSPGDRASARSLFASRRVTPVSSQKSAFVRGQRPTEQWEIAWPKLKQKKIIGKGNFG
jgi:hypothetical protein